MLLLVGCVRSVVLRGKLGDGGCSTKGPLYEGKCTLRRMVTRRVRFRAAKAERARIRRRERLLANKARNRFRCPGSKAGCSNCLLMV